MHFRILTPSHTWCEAASVPPLFLQLITTGMQIYKDEDMKVKDIAITHHRDH
jgi:hypothetical protein